MEQRDNATDIRLGERVIKARFAVTDASDVAGGPVELAFSAELVEGAACQLIAAGDRMTNRPAGFSFAATFAGHVLSDPYADLPDMGGPEGILELQTDRPVHQRLVLNEFVRLEDVRALLAPGATGLLAIECARHLSLVAAGEDAPFDSAAVTVPLALQLRRDDNALDALVRRLLAQVLDGPRDQRERPLSLLLSLRADMAVDRWRTLVSHPDPLVAQRARQSLGASGP